LQTLGSTTLVANEDEVRIFNTVKVTGYKSGSVNRAFHGNINFAQQFSRGIKKGIRNRYNVTFVW